MNEPLEKRVNVEVPKVVDGRSAVPQNNAPREAYLDKNKKPGTEEEYLHLGEADSGEAYGME
jgi:hypothetical protein